MEELRQEAIRARELAIGSIRTEVATLSSDVDSLRAELRDSFARVTALLTPARTS
jgi:hypothetical protein